MKIITIDFETYFDADYTLKKLTTEEYVRNERFEPLGAALYEPALHPFAQWMLPDELNEFLEALRSDQEPIVMLAHHAHFDGLILSHHFGFQPDVWLDTLSMGRVMFDSGVKLGLDDLAGRLGLAAKTVPYDLFKGKHWDELDASTQRQVADGACHDCRLTRQIFDLFMQGGHPQVPYRFPPSELPVIDLTVKMFTNPTLVGNVDKLAAAWKQEQHDTLALFERLSELLHREVTPADLRKDEIFAVCLDELGVEPEVKTTTKGNEKYAFAKSDYFMQDLVSDPDEDVALLAQARLKAHSSIYRTRVERYGWMATRGAMCIYLAYAAAHTRRWGGGDKTNFQNLPRPDPYRPQKGALRRAIEAPCT